MATAVMNIVSFDNGLATVNLEYNDATMRGTALVGVNNSDKTLFVQFEKATGGGGASGTVPPHQERRITLPNGLQLGLDPETNEASITGAGHNVRLLATLG